MEVEPPITDALKLMGDSATTVSGSEKAQWLALVGFLAATFFVAWVSTFFTISAIPTWYAALSKPSFNPPNSLFGPVWTALYCLMAIAAWLVSKRPPSSLRSRALLLFWAQLALNFLWSLIFFGQHLIAIALLDIAMLWLLIALTCIAFFRLNRAAGWMFVPYIAWVGFASILNFEIWRLN
jgi:translocator protein